MRATVRAISISALFVCLAISLPFAGTIRSQAGDLQERIAELKEASAKNKQALAQYTWTERVTISLNGKERKQERFQVRMGPDGKPVKTPIDAPAQDDSAKGGRLRQRIVDKKKEEYRDYADQMKELTQQYIPPDKDRVQEAYSKGNVGVTPDASAPGRIEFAIHDYLRKGDSVTIVFDKEQKRLVSISIHSWIDDPTDVMNLSVQFDKLPDGTNHATGATIEGVRKHMVVVTQNDNYQKL